MSCHQRHAEIADTVRARQKPSQNAGMRAICDRAGRKRLRETDSLLRNHVQRRSLNSVVPVAVHVVSAQSIDGTEKDFRALCPILCSRTRPGNPASDTTTK